MYINALRRCFANKRCSDDESGKKPLHFWLTPLTRVIFPLQLSFIRRFDVCFKREYFSNQNFGRIRSLLSWKKPRAWKDAGFSSRRFSEDIAFSPVVSRKFVFEFVLKSALCYFCLPNAMDFRRYTHARSNSGYYSSFRASTSRIRLNSFKPFPTTPNKFVQTVPRYAYISRWNTTSENERVDK